MSDSTMNKAINEASSDRPTQQQVYQPMTFDSIKIGLASENGLMVRLQSQRLSTIEPGSQSRMVCSVKESLDLPRTGNVTAVSTRRLDIRVLSATVVA